MSFNPFPFLVNGTHDEYIEHADYFILRPHQVVPKYYLFANKQLNKIILHYSMGSGKSASAIFTFLHYLNYNRMKTFNDKYLYTNSNVKIKPNILVVASWMTWQQIDTELINHPEFGMITIEQRKVLDKLGESNLEFDIAKERELRKELTATIHKYIKYVGYQGFFNLLFPEKNISKYGQNIESLVEEYKSGTLVPNKTFIKSLEDTIIIVDEMQKLYSSIGLNTYGFAIAYIAKHADEFKCKLMFLTGTMINSGIGEVPDILNVLADEKKWIDRDDWVEQEVVDKENNIAIWKFKANAMTKSMSMIKDRFLYYDQKQGGTSEGQGKLMKLSKEFVVGSSKPMSLMKDAVFEKEELRAIAYPKYEYLPREYHVGNRVIASPNEEQPLIVYAIPTRGEQDKALRTTNVSDMFANEESEVSLSIHDAYIPPPSQYSKHGIYKQDTLFKGTFLELDKIGNYSAIAYEMCCLCLMNAFNNEKTVLYHNKLNSFGIKQYAEVLSANGFVKYGAQPSRDAICKRCQRPFAEHSLSLEERIKKKVCNEDFAPIFYDYVTGDIDATDRMTITNEVYNNHKNVYGDLIAVLFISDVAYAGVNLLHTHNIMFLSKVNNMSKWKQIYNRVVRVNSHMLLPEDKQYVKIYTFIIEPSGTEMKGGSSTTNVSSTDIREEMYRQQDTSLMVGGAKSSKKISAESAYYKRSIIMNKDVVAYINALSKIAISNTLFEHPDKITFEITRDVLIMFAHDVESELASIIRRATPTDASSEWSTDTFLKRIKDKKYSMSYIDFSMFSSESLKQQLLRNPLLQVSTDGNYIRVSKKMAVEKYQIYNIISYNQFKTLENKKNTLTNLIRELTNEKNYSKRTVILYGICKLFEGKFKELKDLNVFWDAIYDIGDEYYDGDEVGMQFFTNHSPANRSQTKINGFYYGSTIVLRSGEVKRVPIKYITIDGISSHPYIYRIISVPDKGIIGENSPFYLHVKIIKKGDSAAAEIDRRKLTSGVACYSYDQKELRQHFPNIKVSDEVGYKKLFCRNVLFAVCEMQAKTKERFVYSPFEHI